MGPSNDLTAADLRARAAELRDRLFGVLTPFIEANPQLPAQAIMAGLGELLVQFSLSQVGMSETQRLLDELKRAVDHFAPPQH